MKYVNLTELKKVLSDLGIRVWSKQMLAKIATQISSIEEIYKLRHLLKKCKTGRDVYKLLATHPKVCVFRDRSVELLALRRRLTYIEAEALLRRFINASGSSSQDMFSSMEE